MDVIELDDDGKIISAVIVAKDQNYENLLYQKILKYVRSPLPNIDELLRLVKTTYSAKMGSSKIASSNDFKELFKICDDTYYDGNISLTLSQIKKSLIIRYDNSRAGKAGHCGLKKDHYDFFMNFRILEALFSDGRKYHQVGGLKCHDKFDCILYVFLHEMTHLVFQIVGVKPEFSSSRSKCLRVGHSKSFKDLVRNAFGQTEITHAFTAQEGAGASRNDFKLGQKVQFEGKEWTIVKLNLKRARLQLGDRIMIVSYNLLKDPSYKRSEDSDEESESDEDDDEVNVHHAKAHSAAAPVAASAAAAAHYKYVIGYKFMYKGEEFTINKINDKTVRAKGFKGSILRFDFRWLEKNNL